MIIARIALILVAIVIASGIIAYLFTRDKSYLHLAWRVTKWALSLVLLVLCLMFLERLIRV